MQSTLKSAPLTSPASPARPKIGRPPGFSSEPPQALPRIKLVVPGPAEMEGGEETPLYQRKPLLIASALLAIALGAVITLALPPRFTGLEHAGAEPPVPDLEQETFRIQTPEGSLTGRLAQVSEPNAEKSIAPGSTIDNSDRQRLLSILSKD